MTEKKQSGLTHRDGKLMHKAMARQLTDQELVEQVAATLLGSDALRQEQARRILNIPELRSRLEIAQRYEEASAIEVHKYPSSEGGLAQFYKHLAGVTEALGPGTYRLVPEQPEEE